MRVVVRHWPFSPDHVPWAMTLVCVCVCVCVCACVCDLRHNVYLNFVSTYFLYAENYKITISEEASNSTRMLLTDLSI